jgi:C-terminal processing protease CtpA/Prc
MLPGHYRSERVADHPLDGAAPLPAAPEALPRPDEPYETDLGGGVACRVPLAVYADAGGTLPRATAKPRPPRKPADFPPTGDDRATRLADVLLAWNLFQHFYPYFDVVETDWPAALRECLTAAATDPDAAAFHDTLKRLVALAYDSHGTVRGGSGTVAVGGALPLAWDWFEDRLVVVTADRDHAGRVRPGDVVRSIDGTSAAERVRAAERLMSGATPQFRRYRAMQELRNGPVGQPVTLELQPPQGPAYTVTLRRLAADDSPLRGPSLREWRLPRLKELKPGILYVDLDRYDSADYFREVAPKLVTAKGVVFDVRGYPTVDFIMLQPFTDRPLRSDHFIDLITHYPDRHKVARDDHAWSMAPGRGRLPVKAAFLADGRAVSAAETFLSLVANNKVGPIVGGPTAGSNGSINLYYLPGGYRVSYTGMLTIRLDGSRFHGVGVRPTYVVRRTVKAVAEGRDEVLDKAVELVQP